ncbi:MAG TPA: hypothetical protein VJZ02_04155 [Candidatus Brocadiales bacterium]|nr:hypothetical protein [Candidatus Brocadiales bacterium]
MKKLLTLALALVALAAFSVVSFAQQKAFGAETVHLYLKVTGKVTKVNEKAKPPTFTVMAKGKEVTFTTKLSLPEVGKIIDITYTENPSGPMEATTINTSKSNTY